jgi:ATP-dependent helicase/nuclease subunit A
MDVIPHQDAVLIRASAGTGKTFQLSTRLLQLLVSGQPIDKLLATTFTRKAAGEILDRVLERLADAIEQPKKLVELNGSLVGIELSAPDCAALLKKLAAQLHRLRISTLDSFFSQLARAYAFELRLPGGWQLMDPQREQSIRQQAIQSLLDQHDRGQLRTMLNLLGKGEYSAGILREIERTVESGAALAEITSAESWENPQVTKAPGESELEFAIHDLEPNSGQKISLSKALTKLQNQILESDWENIAASTLIQATEMLTPKFSNAIIPDGIVSALKIVRQQAMHVALSIYRNQTTSSRELLDFYLNYLESQKRQIREWTFEDVSRKLARWLNTDELATESLGFRLDFSIDHLLLDEFQDTSLIQWEVLQPFVASISRRRQQEHCSFFCVGDTKQAIYGWRGGIAELFDEVERRISELRTMVLTASRRSSQVVLDTVNQVFANLDQHEEYGKGAIEAQRWLANFQPHSAHHQGMPGYVALYQGANDKSLKAHERELKLLTKAAEDVAHIAKLHPHGSIGILVRTNDEVGLMIDLLRKYKLDVSQEGGNPLTDSAAVEVVLSLLTIVDHPGNSVAVWHLQHSPLATHFDKAILQSPGELSWRLRSELSQLGLVRFLTRYCDLLANSCNERDQLRLEQLIQQGFSFAVQHHSRIMAFVEHIRQQKVALPQPAQVRVMNIHQSKGLEFDSVFLPNLNDSMTGQLPLFVAMRNAPTERPSGVVRYMKSEVQQMLDKKWLEAFRRDAGLRISESLCVLYVAMTRAKHGLYMYITAASDKQKATMASLLQSTLVEAGNVETEDAISYQVGDPLWYQQVAIETNKRTQPRKEIQPSLFAGAESAKVKSKSRREMLQRGKSMFATALKCRRLEAAVAPSQLVGEKGAFGLPSAELSQRIGQLFGAQTTTAVLEGTIMHAWFAEIHWRKDLKDLETELFEVAAKAIDRSYWGVIDLEPLWKKFLSHWEQPQIAALFDPVRYAPVADAQGLLQVETEKRFATLLNQRLIQGSIDRLVMTSVDDHVQFAEIIDFKTDQCLNRTKKKEWVSEHVSKYRPQLSAYADVVAKVHQLSKAQIRTTLVLLDVGEVVEVSSRA